MSRGPLYFDSHVTIRLNSEMVKLINYWIKNPKCVMKDGKKLFKDRSHFIKCALVKYLEELEDVYKD